MPTDQTTPIHSTLFCFNSKPDRAGGRYWAFRFVDHATGRSVKGTIGRSTSDSNIYAILRHWDKPDDWDRGIQFVRIEKGIRDFNEMTKDWPYAGCNPEDLAAFIRRGLSEGASS